MSFRSERRMSHATSKQRPKTAIAIRNSLLHRLALRALRSRYSSADARPLQFQQSARRVSGLPRLWPHDRDRSEPRDSRSQPEHRARRGARFSRRRIRRIAEGSAPRLRPRRDRRHVPFEELPKADQDFVINGEKRSANTPTRTTRTIAGTACAAFFKWLESKTYKMHVRVLLSRYRAYTTCPDCNGGRFQPETLNYRIVSRGLRRNGSRKLRRTLPEVAALSISDARELLRAI